MGLSWTVGEPVERRERENKGIELTGVKGVKVIKFVMCNVM